MTFNIVGTGNMAWFLATQLTAAGYKCLQVCGRDTGKTHELADAVNAATCYDPEKITDEADCCIIAVSDTAIAGVAKKIKLTKSILIHTAGAADINLLTDSAAHYGVLWPVYSIQKETVSKGVNIPFAIEGNNTAATELIKKLAVTLGGYAFEAGLQQRCILHLCAVLSNNFTNHLLTITEQLCTDNNLPFETLKPIIQETFENIRIDSPRSKQTGPAKRNDAQTIKRHLELLKGNPEWQQVYEAISASIGKMYK